MLEVLNDVAGMRYIFKVIRNIKNSNNVVNLKHLLTLNILLVIKFSIEIV